MAGIAILGFGVVGSGVAEVIQRNGSHIDQKLHSNLELKHILDVKDFPDSPFGSLVVRDFSVIEADPAVDVVVETIGGVEVAREYTQRALAAGKSVVTSNKELVATYGYELMCLAKENGVSYLYEASVGGGIPIIRPLKQCLAANEISEICGILNGTTNYILTRMIRAGISFQDALAEAQAKGYAEADPTADVEGHDACRKICILAALAFGRHLSPRQVSTEGISQVSLSDVAYAESRNYQIKLLGRAMREPDGKIRAFVAPHLIPSANPLSGVEGVFNAITVKGNAIGDVMFYGRGAGKLPTASAVVADVMEAVSRKNAPKYLDWNSGGEDVISEEQEQPCIWYVRVSANEERLSSALEHIEILKADLQGREGSAVLIGPMTEEKMRKSLSSLGLQAAFRVLKD